MRDSAIPLLHPLRIHALQAILLQVLAHDPRHIGIGIDEPLLHGRFTFAGQRDDGDTPAIAERLPQRLEVLGLPIGFPHDRGRDRVQQFEHALARVSDLSTGAVRTTRLQPRVVRAACLSPSRSSPSTRRAYPHRPSAARPSPRLRARASADHSRTSRSTAS